MGKLTKVEDLKFVAECRRTEEIMEVSDEYVHYGCNADDYNVNKFEKIRNIPYFSKPFGGFWASPTRRSTGLGCRTPFDWKDFCREAEYYPKGGVDKKFYFCLDINANIFRIESMSDYNLLPKTEASCDGTERKEEFIDFEECVRQGIDAIEYSYSIAHQDEDVGDEMNMKMLGWDCDCILIMNPDIILKDSF